MSLLIDHRITVIAPPGERPRLRHEVSTRAGDHGPRRSGYRLAGGWHSPALGPMWRWRREYVGAGTLTILGGEGLP